MVNDDQSKGLRAALDPYLTVLGLVTDISTGASLGTPSEWLNRTSAALSPEMRRALAPLATLPRSGAPEHVLPALPTQDFDIANMVERLESLTEDGLVASIHQAFGPTGGQWKAVLNQPRDWLETFSAAVRTVAEQCDDMWRSAQKSLSRSVDKLGGILIRGGLERTLRLAHSRYLISEDQLDIVGTTVPPIDVSRSGLTLVPMLSGRKRPLFRAEQPDNVWLGYPACGVLAESEVELDTDSLETLLGPARARILRLLDRDRSMHEIASQVYITRATATYHCGWLEKNKLIVRQRTSTTVNVARARRGEELLRIFSS